MIKDRYFYEVERTPEGIIVLHIYGNIYKENPTSYIHTVYSKAFVKPGVLSELTNTKIYDCLADYIFAENWLTEKSAEEVSRKYFGSTSFYRLHFDEIDQNTAEGKYYCECGKSNE